ncbi:MAG: 50S ribosome-binding GTPase [Planctomycetes bacterium]|nr:50S ribosome-binding GTPase [Planctomycetota bacterium]
MRADTMPADTIVAESSAPGAGERAVLRLSGPRARDAAALVFAPVLPDRRAQIDGDVEVRGHRLPAFALVMPGPRSFTGEDVVELHLPGGALLVRCVLDALLARGERLGLRAALAGEFTARAFTNGRLDLAAAEGILMLLHAQGAQQVAAAVQWVGGGLSNAIDALRDGLHDVLAALEAGLDFTDEELPAAPAAQFRAQLDPIAAQLDELLQHLPAAAPGGELLLVGRSNAGKSSLCNALLGREASLVDCAPGTTRDLLRHEVGGAVLWDAPGDLDAPGAADAAALALRDRLAGRAAAVVWVVDATAPVPPSPRAAGEWSCLGVVFTKVDLLPAGSPPPAPPGLAQRLTTLPQFFTSARTGAGLVELRAWLARVGSAQVAPGAPLREPLLAAQRAVARALDLADAGAELIALELQAALRCLDDAAGRHSAEPLLDRIYGRFCLGK